MPTREQFQERLDRLNLRRERRDAMGDPPFHGDPRPKRRREPPTGSFSPDRPRPSFTQASTLDRRNRRDEMRQRRRDEMMRRRERGEFGGRPSFGGDDREDNVGSRPSPSPAISTVDDSAPRRKPKTMGGKDSSDSGNFLNNFVSTLRS